MCVKGGHNLPIFWTLKEFAACDFLTKSWTFCVFIAYSIKKTFLCLAKPMSDKLRQFVFI